MPSRNEKTVPAFQGTVHECSFSSEHVESAPSWRKAAAHGTNARKIFTALSHEMQEPVGLRVAELIAENVKYIKSVTQEWTDLIYHTVCLSGISEGQTGRGL